MVLFPNAKINIGLYVTEKRADGFHNLETVFYPIGLRDILEINLWAGEGRGRCDFQTTGIPMDCNPEQNLVVRAYHLLHEALDLPAVRVHLHKLIPFGAGLGGGSSDAAFMLKGLNKLCGLGLSDEQLETYAVRLGSDCAFFIRDVPVFATGKGEIMEELPLVLKDYTFVLVKPGRGVSTPEAYAGITPKAASFDLRQLPHWPVERWAATVSNDFEASVARKIPEIRHVRQRLEQLGACYVSMTGSGSAVYALFPHPVEVQFEFPGYYTLTWSEGE